MKRNWIKLLAVASLIAAIGIYAPVQSADTKAATGTKSAVAAKPAPKKPAAKKKPAATAPKPLPRLLDLGSTTCVPCKMMTPILEELKKEYKGKLKVQFIDVWKNESAAKKYKVQSIPTQIFFNAKGKEVYRHVGFFPKADILKAFKDHGIKLTK